MAQHLRTEVVINPATLPLDLVPDQYLAKEAQERIHAAMGMIERDCRRATDLLQKVGERWTLIAPEYDVFLETVTGKPAAYIRKIINGVEAIRAEGKTGEISVAEACARAEKNPMPEQEIGKGKAGPGKGNKTDNNVTRLRGNSQTYTLRRLARDNPELLARVKNRELSPNQAAIQAGFRKPTKSIPIDSADSAMEALRRIFSKAELLATFSDQDLAAEITQLEGYRLRKSKS